MSNSSIVDSLDLYVHFGPVRAVDGVSFSIKSGETFGLIGESGSGKSTLGRAVVGLVKPTSGTVIHDGVNPFELSMNDFRSHRRNYQIIFQDPNAALNPRMNILESIKEPLDILGLESRNQRLDKVFALLEMVGIPSSFATRYPHELSGGQKQRVNIARALIVRPRLLVCDEIVAALDISIQADILNLLAKLQHDFGLTYLFITHDLGVVSHISDRIAVMYLGLIVEMGSAESIRSDPRHPYTEALLSAEPMPLPYSMRIQERIILEGEIPSPIDPPSGCRFRTRCRYAQSICEEIPPEFREVETGHWVACHISDDLRFQPAGKNRLSNSANGIFRFI